MRRVFLALVLLAAVGAARGTRAADALPSPDPAKLIGRLRIAYLQPPSFQPVRWRRFARSQLNVHARIRSLAMPCILYALP